MIGAFAVFNLHASFNLHSVVKADKGSGIEFWKKPLPEFKQSNAPVKKQASVKVSEGNGLCFTPNMGQVADLEGKVRPEVLYSSDGDISGKIFLRKTGISYVVTDFKTTLDRIYQEVEKAEEVGLIDEVGEKGMRDKLINAAVLNGYRVDIDFVGANPSMKTINSEAVSGYVNFYYPHCSDGVTGVKQFNKVVYENVYKNIDVVFSGSKGQGMKYDFVIKPGADVSEIKLKYSGADKVTLNNGKINVFTKFGNLTEWMPKVYQTINGKEVNVKSEYVISNNAQKETFISFKCSSYNSAYPLIIDPWITYYGGSFSDESYAIKNDNIGNCITAGHAMSVNFPVSAGAFQTAISGMKDAFALSLQPNGSIRNFATYYGGSGMDYGNGVYADAFNNIIFSGGTPSANFPVGAIGANVVFQSVPGSGFYSGFIVKLNSAGVRQFGTYVNSQVTDVCVDNADNIIAIGSTDMSTGIATSGAYKTALSGTSDGYVMKFLPNGARSWGTYIGGSSASDSPGAVITDKSTGEIYFTGGTASPNFPTLAGHQMAYGGNNFDAFLTKMNPSGTALLWSTFYGGNKDEFGVAIILDNVGNVIIGGECVGALPVGIVSTAGSYQPAYGGGVRDAFIAKFNSSGVRQWATMLGGVQADYAQGLGVDPQNNIVASGDTYSSNLLPTSCAYQNTFQGTEDQWVITFLPSGVVKCLTYMGQGNSGTPNNEGGGLSVFGCHAYLLANVHCTYPVTSGAYQTVCGGGLNMAIAQLDVNSCGLPTLPSVVSQTTTASSCLCNGTATLNLTAGCMTPPFCYFYSNGAQTLNTTSLTDSIKNLCGGNYNYTVTTTCDTILGSFVIPGGSGALIANYTQTDISCSSLTGGITITSITNGTPNYILTEGTNTLAANFNVPYILNGIAPGAHTYKLYSSTGCFTIFNVNILNGTSSFNVNAPSPVKMSCSGDPVNLNVNTNANGAVTYLWTGPGIVSGANTAIASVNQPGSYTITVSQGLCSATAVVNVLPSAVGPVGQITAPSKGCAAFCPTFSLTSTDGVSTVSWNFGDGTSGAIGNPIQHCFTNSTNYTVTGTFTDNNGCVGKANKVIEVFPKPTADFNFSPQRPIITEPEVSFTDASYGTTIVKWDWYFTNLPKPHSNERNPKYIYTETGQYNAALIVTSNYGCTDTLIKTVIIGEDYGIFVPNAFTPNGDGSDDIFQPKGFGISKYEFVVFDRWGEKLFYSNDFNLGWDGTYKGKLSPMSVYVWKITLTDAQGKFHELSGHVTLIK